MKLYSLGAIDWKDTQLYYHSMAYLRLEGVIICRSRTPYYCVGFHQSVKQELNLPYLEANGIPFFRRESGGGTVRLDNDQVFYQIIMRKENPKVPAHHGDFFQMCIDPAIKALRSMGVVARIEPPNDILVNGKKISGNGGGEIGECKVAVGDILYDFDAKKMCQGLNSPTQGFLGACENSMIENITSIREELPDAPREVLENELVKEYSRICEGDIETALPNEVHEKAKDIEKRMLDPEWLLFPRSKRPGRRIKVREGVYLALIDINEASDLIGWLQVRVENRVLKDLVVIAKEAEDTQAISRATMVLQTLLGNDKGPFRIALDRILGEMGLDRNATRSMAGEIISRFRLQSKGR